MDIQTQKSIEALIVDKMQEKIARHTSETNHTPFQDRILGNGAMQFYSLVHSVNTSLGQSIYENVAAKLAGPRFNSVETQFSAGDEISLRAQGVIQEILNGLSRGKQADKSEEVERIRDVCDKGKISQTRHVKVDLFVRDDRGVVYLIEVKTVKPNKAGFADIKKQLLSWIASYLLHDPLIDVRSYVAFPYNPYHPEPYARWTVGSMLDWSDEVLVAEDFWDFIGGEDSYDSILDCFERAGSRVRGQVDEFLDLRSSLLRGR